MEKNRDCELEVNSELAVSIALLLVYSPTPNQASLASSLSTDTSLSTT